MSYGGAPTKPPKPPKQKQPGGSFNKYMHPHRHSFLVGLRKFIGTGICILITLFLLSGGINYVKTGESLLNYALHIGRNIGETLKSIPEGGGPFKFTKDGVYFKDADIPENSALEGLDEKMQDKLEESKPKEENKEDNNNNKEKENKESEKDKEDLKDN